MIEKFLGFIVAVQVTFLFGCYILVQKCGPCAYIPPPSPTSENYSQSSATDDNNETLIIVATPTYKRVSRFIFFIFQ